MEDVVVPLMDVETEYDGYLVRFNVEDTKYELYLQMLQYLRDFATKDKDSVYQILKECCKTFPSSRV